MPRASRVGLSLVVLTVLACGGATEEVAGHADEPVSRVALALEPSDPVSDAVSASCTTASVKGLSTQLVAEIGCMRPGSMKSIEGAPGLDLGAAVFPYLQTPAADALVAAQRSRGVTMTINSALRTLPQQYLLYRWYQAGRCGISLATAPGKSNHETAVAVDIADADGWRPAMSAASFRWLGESDPVHFDFTGEGAIDLRGLSVTAFQRLWNRNHPEDPLVEDGAYGPETEKRLARAPVGGFPRGAEACSGDAGAAPAPAPAPAVTEPVPDAPEPPDDGGCAVARAPRRAWGLGLEALAALAALAVARRARRATRRAG